MVFSDLFFLFVFLPAFALCYLAAAWIDRQIPMEEAGEHSHLFQNSVLVVFSLIFYAWGEPVYVFLMLFCVLVNYLAGLGINSQTGGARRWALAAGLTGNILILSTFKYLSFFAQQLNALGVEVADPKISLPIGISFYTFQSISYLIDVYRREAPVQRHFGNLLLYISMFPQLIAGPIVRYNTVAREINSRHISSSDVAEGMYRFMIGLGKKVILANQLSEISDQFLANSLQDLTTTGSWVGIVAFTLQIYFDFSGYSDMAIGLGRCLGFHFNENFRHPIWGVYFGFIVTIEKYTLLRVHRYIPSPLLHLYSLVLVVIGWGIFYFDDSSRMMRFFQICFGQGSSFHDFVTISALMDNCWLWVVCLLFCMPIRHWTGALWQRIAHQGGFIHESLLFASRLTISAFLLVLSVALLVGATNNAFIYTRF